MKKLYFLFTFLLLSSLTFSQTASITKIIETSCSGPFLKTVEIAVTGTVDFANDDIQLRYSNNGNGFSPAGVPNLIDISGLGVQTNTYVYLIRDLALMQADFPNSGITTANSIVVGSSTNGDDAYQLAMADGTVLSQFGVDNEDGSGTPWEHKDAFAERNAGTTETGTFAIGDWTFSAVDFLDDYGVCAKSSGLVGDLFETVISLRTWITLSSDQFNTNSFSIYPNPVTDGFVNIKSNNSDAINVAVYDILGKQISNTTLANNQALDVSELKSGIYVLQISQNDTSISKKLIIK